LPRASSLPAKHKTDSSFLVRACDHAIDDVALAAILSCHLRGVAGAIWKRLRFEKPKRRAMLWVLDEAVEEVIFEYEHNGIVENHAIGIHDDGRRERLPIDCDGTLRNWGEHGLLLGRIA
jgi:hypothetical protein